jgi:ATP-dependent DNA helicase RecG
MRSMSEEETDNPIAKLTQPVQFIKGVGSERAKVLERLNLRTAADLLFFFPRSYEDFTQLHKINQLEHEQLANIVGTVLHIDGRNTSTGRHMLTLLVEQDNQHLKAMWFNQPFMMKRFQVGQRLLLRGKAKLHAGRFQMSHPKITTLDADADIEETSQLLPVYRLTDGVGQQQMRAIVAQAVEDFAGVVQEAFPESLRQHADVCDITSAIRQIHSPETQAEIDAARGRLVYQELLILQLALAVRRHRTRTALKAPPLELTPKIRSRILGRLPFELTESQQTALDEIAANMSQPFPMNRLLHGEVGSGKTVVAVCAMMLAVAHGYQAAMMAPTEILARQHYRTLKNLLGNSRVRIGLWIGSLKGAERKQLKSEIEAGEVDIVVGTQAVVASRLNFHKPGLVVIDEQHKFGVRQRASLKQSGEDPHYLVMTATPIPRTMSMTVFGDLDVSTLKRTSGIGQRVNTYLGKESAREQWWQFVAKKLREGRQAFVVAPLVESDEDTQLSSAERMYESLSNGPLEAFRLDVLHGRQAPEQKDEVMAAFASGQTQAIVATGVVEVGIDVPNATVMTIESAERFGLSQLHQLRGRVSRGKHPGFVCAFATGGDAEDNERLAAFAETANGFDLAEIDLKLRGPGNLFSTHQSGFPPLMIADLIRDADLLTAARTDALQLVDADPNLEHDDHDRLRQLVFARYGHALNLSDVG